MRIGIIGAGVVGQALAGRFVAAGAQVLLSNRAGPESLRDLAYSVGPGLAPVTVEEAAVEEIEELGQPCTPHPICGH